VHLAASTPQIPPTPEELLSVEITRRLFEIVAGLSEGKPLGAGDLEVLDGLSCAYAALLPRKVGRKRESGIIALSVGGVVLFAAAFVRLPATAVELDMDRPPGRAPTSPSACRNWRSGNRNRSPLHLETLTQAKTCELKLTAKTVVS
jgi:hypothetical protein